jgi:hypothetical protein
MAESSLAIVQQLLTLCSDPENQSFIVNEEGVSMRLLCPPRDRRRVCSTTSRRYLPRRAGRRCFAASPIPRDHSPFDPPLLPLASPRINKGCVSGLVTYLKNSDDNVVCMAAQAMQFLSSNADNIATLRVQPGLIANLVRWIPPPPRARSRATTVDHFATPSLPAPRPTRR